MNTDGSINPNNIFYTKGEDGEYKPLVDLTSISIELSEEDSARLWALCEGLEIVK